MKRSLLALVLVASWPTAAAANPISAERLVVRQVPETTHVQITVAYDPQFAADSAVVSATRDGSDLGGSWAAAAGYETNMGSGVVAVAGYQYCDCNLALGSHAYNVTTSGENGCSYDRTIEVVEDYELPEATGGQGGYMGGWEEPDPIEMQGIDCVTHCNGASDGDGVGGNATSTGGGTVDEAEKADGDSDNGCAIGRGPASGRSSAPWLLLGALLLRRRRRRSKIQL